MFRIFPGKRLINICLNELRKCAIAVIGGLLHRPAIAGPLKTRRSSEIWSSTEAKAGKSL